MSTNYAIRIFQTGGPEQLVVEDTEIPRPRKGEVLVRNTAVGLNFIDTYHRSGLYPLSTPFTLGVEGAGIIEKIGPDVDNFQVGDRVAYADPMGAYALYLVRPADRLLKLPDDLSDEIAAAAMLKGLTAHYLIHDTHRVKSGETILVYAAAGGVGQLLSQWANRKGAFVIGAVGESAKVSVARQAGCDQVIDLSKENLVERVRECTAGEGVSVVYDGIGKATFYQSLDCLAPRGLMVSYGNASGAVEAFTLAELVSRGSLYVTRPTLQTYVASSAELQKRAQDLFAMLGSKQLRIEIGQRFPLAEAAHAHQELEACRTTGSTLLIP